MSFTFRTSKYRRKKAKDFGLIRRKWLESTFFEVFPRFPLIGGKSSDVESRCQPEGNNKKSNSAQHHLCKMNLTPESILGPQQLLLRAKRRPLWLQQETWSWLECSPNRQYHRRCLRCGKEHLIPLGRPRYCLEAPWKETSPLRWCKNMRFGAGLRHCDNCWKLLDLVVKNR